MSAARLAALALALAAPSAAGALEPRFDHRDQQGLVLALETWRDTVAVKGQPTISEVHPRLRAGWSTDISGEGDELILGGSLRADGFGDPARNRYIFGVDGRYRGYFGSEELKTFFELGGFLEIKDRLVVGPSCGLGATYDPNRAWGVFVSASFQAGLGDARMVGFGGAIGLQLRFD